MGITSKTREKLAETILNDFKNAITGNNIDRVVDANPEDMFYVGKLVSVHDSDNTELFSSKTFIESIGVDFYIAEETISRAMLKLYPQGDFYYRAFPTLDEQRRALLSVINKSNKSTEIFYTDFMQLLIDYNTDPSKFERYTLKLIPVYKKIQLHKRQVAFEIKLKDIMDDTNNYGFTDKGHQVNKQLDDYLQSLQDNIENDEEHYSSVVKQEVRIEDLKNEETWNEFLNTNAKKQVNIMQRWSIYFDIAVKKVQEKYLVSVTIVNDSDFLEMTKANKIKERIEKDRITLETMFNSGIKIQLIDSEFIPIELDYFINDYKYNRTQEAIGTNCSVEYIRDENTIITEHLPTYRQYRLVTNDNLAVSFKDLIKDPISVLNEIKRKMDHEYKLWEDYKKQKYATLTLKGRESIEKEIKDFESEIKRFSKGVDLINNYPELKKSFILMNKTFLNASQKYNTWRLFQIVFIVSLIPDIAACDENLLAPYEKNNTFLNQMDLLFFPTGGGKTEAFLGILVFNLFFDRFRGKTFGVTAILRYPLRLLSVQQVQRLANILAQAELLRREENSIRNSEVFSLGYFVGDVNTPNQLTKDDIDKIKGMTQKTKDEKRVMDICPFCGQQSIHLDVDEDSFRLIHYCSNEQCTSGGILPVYIVDREIYRYLPSAIISTVDKLAVIGNNRNFRNVLNGVTTKCPKHGYSSSSECIEKENCSIEVDAFKEVKMYDPTPSLFIQDELHLIRESLGTYASHYESFIDYFVKELSTSKRGAKVIGATATISSYEIQVYHLYKKNAIRFPTQSPFLDRNFYAHIDKNDLQRLILGYAPYGKAIVNSVVYSLKYMRQIVFSYYCDPQKVLNIPGIGINRTEDAIKILEDYWIFLEYNNVKRDGNNVEGALETPINIELREEKIIPFNTRKMTGDESFQDVREVLAEVENSSDVFNENGVNLIAATSMISHGVDADRFNVMFFYGIPGNTAEYIQAYSRTGRRHSSIVVDIMRPTRETDQSYLKNFIKFHDYKDIMVDSVPINRWATKAIDNTLPGIFAGLLINYYDIELQYSVGSLFAMKNIQKAIVTGAIKHDELKNHLYKAYGCIDDELGNQYKAKINIFVDDILLKIRDKNWTWRDYLIDGFASIGYKIMRSLRDTDTQLIIELE